MKAQLSLQFNWIFVLVIGVVLIGIFFVQIDNATKKSRYESSLSLRASLQGMFVVTESEAYKTIELGLVTLTNICEPEASTLYLGKGALPVDTTYYALHTPKKINSKKLHLQVEEDIPFLCGEDRIYYFVENSYYEAQISYLYNKIKCKKEIIQFSELSSYPPTESSLKSTMIYFTDEYNQASLDYNSEAKNFEIVVVNPGSIFSSGNLYFGTKFSKPLITDKAPYMNFGELLGGIIDSDLDIYSCVHNQQLNKEYRNLLLLSEKVSLMLNSLNSGYCFDLFSYLDNELNIPLDILYELISGNDNYTENDYLNSLKRIYEINEDLARNSCPIIL